MADDLKEMLAGLRAAMQAERTGEQFYRAAAERTLDPLGREVFAHLAEEEAEHFRFLKAHYQAIGETGQLADVALGKGAQLGDESPIFSPGFRQRIREAHFEMSALAIAVQLELNGIRHYQEQARAAKAPAARKFFEDLAHWESGHYDALLRQQKLLEEEYWREQGFEPF